MFYWICLAFSLRTSNLKFPFRNDKFTCKFFGRPCSLAVIVTEQLTKHSQQTTENTSERPIRPLAVPWRSPEFRPTSAQISLRSFVPNAPKFRSYFIEMRSTTQRGNFMCNRQGEDMRATFLHTYLLTVHLYLLTYPTERLS